MSRIGRPWNRDPADLGGRKTAVESLLPEGIPSCFCD